MKSSSALEGLGESRLEEDLDLAGLLTGVARGDGATLLIVLFAGLL